MDISRKFWSHIEKNLEAVVNDDFKNQKFSTYFAGGTLCLDKDNYLYMLRINGVGTISPLGKSSREHNPRVIMPGHVVDLVRKVYLKYKGPTKHYNETVKNHAMA